MKISFFEMTENWQVEMAKKAFPKDELFFFDKMIQDVDIKEFKNSEVISTFCSSDCNSDILSKCKKLKFIATRSTGFNHIDTKYCKKNKIQVTNVPFYGENTVAEFAFGMMITITRKLIDSVNRVSAGSFNFDGLRGIDLKGKTVGLLGFGHIGQKFAKMCKGFDMNVIAYDAFADKLGDVAESIGVTLVSDNEVLKNSDIISLHMPLLESTKHILDKKAFRKMKEGVVIINTSRGELIDSDALIWAVDNKIVASAALDVVEAENELKAEMNEHKHEMKSLHLIVDDHKLINYKNVLVTPHNAFNTIEAITRIVQTSIDNIKCYQNGDKCLNLVK